jgi:co-chaperonin GroES (HSP10)
VDKEYDSGIIKAGETVNYEEKLATVLFVVEVGPDCYKDATRFPSGPWCKQGDFVIVRPHAGTRLLIHGKEFRMINDDSVEAVVQDPRGIKRAN